MDCLNNTAWGRILEESGEGDASISFKCERNYSSAKKETTITIKTASFNKDISIIQIADTIFKPGLFAKLKSSTLFVKLYVRGIFDNQDSRFLQSPHEGEDAELYLMGYFGSLPVLEMIMSFERNNGGGVPIFLKIILNNKEGAMDNEGGAQSFFKPHDVYFDFYHLSI